MSTNLLRCAATLAALVVTGTALAGCGAQTDATEDVAARADDLGPFELYGGDPQTITLPTTTATLQAAAGDQLTQWGTWYAQTGPVGASVTYPWDYESPVTGLTQPGTYTFSIMTREVATQNPVYATAVINVVAGGSPNRPPSVSAGGDVSVQLPTSSVTLSGGGSDPDGDTLAFSWSQIAGNPASIGNPNSASTGVSGLAEGSYAFRLRADDGHGGVATSDVRVNVAPPASGVGTTSLRPLGTTGAPLGFAEYLPPGYGPGANVPLMIFMHGAGEKGNGSESDLPKVLLYGPNTAVTAGKASIPMVILSPQTSQGSWDNQVGNTDRIDQLISYALATYSVDPRRIYVTGWSLGGGGTWAYGVVHPERPAALVPLAGFGSQATPSDAARMIDQGVAVWAFHAVDDTAVGVKATTNWLGAFAQNYGINAVTDTYSLPGAPDIWGIHTDTTFHIDAQAHAWVQTPGVTSSDAGRSFSPKQFGTFYAPEDHHDHFITTAVYEGQTLYNWLLAQSRP